MTEHLMDTNKLIKKHNRITELIAGKQVRQSINIIKELIDTEITGSSLRILRIPTKTWLNIPLKVFMIQSVIRY